MNIDLVKQALRTVKYPGFSRDIVSFGLIKEVTVEEGVLHVRMEIQTRDPEIPQQIFKASHEALAELPDIGTPKIEINIKDAPAGTAEQANTGKSSIPGVKKILAVASGKGGVGKSTVASNLAIALAATGAKVGLCDCDLYGPSVAMMFGSHDRPMANEHDEIIPIEAHGVKLMSMGFLLEERSPVIVRGPMATRYTQQFLRQVDWGELDYLVLDLPPGTGDIQLTIVQTVAVDGAVIVTTPQEIALIDARKAVSMFAKVNVPILGLIENMAWFECDHGTRYHLFGNGGGAVEAATIGTPLLAQIPIEAPVREGGDAGRPIALTSPIDSAASAAFHDSAAQLAARLKP
ncbi:ATP-binding protein involved in chromosome partitioning [Haloferula luteola]|uniref:Iron-sulfur cluster carrier protein n=1 Tax=Haloferula luteola TaxID=595692 RepID=A0A840UY34_9BACT|nr:Mrp/NBP35 family ATP-binding protein [Haloferula luteola]MBB5350645.1 ATP-binding protein involved in chromosome partitioning [Haloferula luteola]